MVDREARRVGSHCRCLVVLVHSKIMGSEFREGGLPEMSRVISVFVVFPGNVVPRNK